MILAIVAVITFCIYLFSLCPTVYLIDSGELAAASYTLGIAHPTGYPLYTLISYFFAHIPGEPIKNLNLLSALFAVAGAVLVYLVTRDILKNKTAPIIISSLFAFSPTIWRTSITNEVYPLTALFCILIFYILYKMRSTRSAYFLMYVIGLAFTNHMSIFALAIPVFVYWILVYRPSFTRVVAVSMTALLGVSLYLYLIARTLGGAELAWGNVYNLQRLFWHVTGKQYQVWMFSLAFSEIMKNAKQGLSFLLADFTYIFAIPCFLGLYHLFRSEPRKFWLLLSIFLLNFLYTINYAIPDIESYYIPGFIALLIAAAYGLKVIARYAKWYTVLPLALLVPVINYHSVSLRNDEFGIQFGQVHLDQLPENSLLISNYWDVVSPTIYLQVVKKVRTDIIVIDKELLRRTWYLKYLARRHPEFCRSVENQINEYLNELYKFEYSKPYDPNTIQYRYIRLLKALVDAKKGDGVFFSLPIPDRDMIQVKPEYNRKPYGLVFAVADDTAQAIFDFSRLVIKRPPSINDTRLGYNIEIVKTMVRTNIVYLNSINRSAEAGQAKIWLNNFNPP